MPMRYGTIWSDLHRLYFNTEQNVVRNFSQWMYICPHIPFLFLPSLVSDELLQKSINTIQGNLKKLDKELETYKQLNDPDDQFLPVMKISF